MLAAALIGLALAIPQPLVTAPGADLSGAPAKPLDPQFFEGRWAFEEDSCEAASNWTLIAGGNFVSEDLIGTWSWNDNMLTLNLTDLAVDEETGETGGRFEMQGPVQKQDADRFTLTIEPDQYVLKRCP